MQNTTNRQDPFDYLDNAEIAALKSLVNRGANNQFVALYRQRQDLEVLLATIEELRTERNNLEQTRAGGNEFIISNYEESQRKLDKAKIAEGQLKQEIQKLDNRIHRYDVQIQQEPDLKYDTLVKLKPFFEKVADSLLKRKRRRLKARCSSNSTACSFPIKDTSGAWS